MAKVRYEVLATTGTYKDKDGNEKKRYQKLGVVMQSDKGFSLKIESIPIGWDGWAYLAEPKEMDKGKPKETKSVADMDEDIPW